MELNRSSLYHLRSYVLQELGILTGVNSWDGIPQRQEPVEIQDNKRRAWLQSRDQKAKEEVETEGETNLEEDEYEYPITVVPDSQSAGSSS